MRNLPPQDVFSRADARACGWSDSAITRAVRSGRLQPLRRAHFTARPGPDPVLAARAAAAACLGSVISHRSAALIHGLPLLDGAADRPDLTVQPRCTGDVAGALLHRATMADGDIVVVGGVPVTAVSRTVVDLARTVSRFAAVVACDAALHAGLTDAEELCEVVQRCASWPRVRRARQVLRLADGRAESPLETVSRLVIAALDLPRAHPQAVIRTSTGRFVARGDFYWDEAGVVGEADGRGKYDGRDVLTAEKARQEALEELGLVVVRWTWADVRQADRQAAFRARILRAFERGRRRDASGFPRLWSVDPA